VLTKAATNMKEQLTLDNRADISFMQDYLQVCTYVELALGSLKAYVEGEKELDKQLFDRYVDKCEQAMTRLLKEGSGGQ
jgi:hypothetical protein